MNERVAATPRTPAARDAAVEKLRSLTVRIAFLSTAAVGGFGYLAAETYAGADSAVPSGGTNSAESAAPTPAATSNSTTQTAAPSATLKPATTTPQTTTRHSHVTTGGS